MERNRLSRLALISSVAISPALPPPRHTSPRGPPRKRRRERRGSPSSAIFLSPLSVSFSLCLFLSLSLSLSLGDYSPLFRPKGIR